MKPLLFLDVDGVINVSGDTPLSQYVGDLDGLFKIHLPYGLNERIATLAENFEIVWATTWMEKAQPFFKHRLALPEEPWACIEPFRESIKLPQICDMAGGRPFAWVDDEAYQQIHRLTYDGGDSTWGEKPGIIVAPLWTEGLNNQHVDELLAWRESLP